VQTRRTQIERASRPTQAAEKSECSRNGSRTDLEGSTATGFVTALLLGDQTIRRVDTVRSIRCSAPIPVGRRAGPR